LNQEESRIATLISGKMDLKTKAVKREKRGYKIQS
jgi:hypothetical protein